MLFIFKKEGRKRNGNNGKRVRRREGIGRRAGRRMGLRKRKEKKYERMRKGRSQKKVGRKNEG